MAELLPFETALEQVLSAFEPCPATKLCIDETLGFVLSESLKSRINQPPNAVSAMDGYAVLSSDALKQRTCIGESAAGHPFQGTLKTGECVRIFTGAFVPNGADAILIQENAEVSGSQITPTEAVTEGLFVRPKGLDISIGQIVPKGTELNARTLSLVAAMNIGSVPVHRKPRVAILSSGDEIKAPGSELKEGEIASSNHIAIASLVTQAGGEPHFLGIAPDDLNAIETLIDQARDYDLLITSGGASVGDHDLMKQAFENQGATLEFKKIAMKPGKPMIFGKLGKVPVLGLPGNPVSSYITALVFAFPAIQLMCGKQPKPLQSVAALLEQPLKANGPRREFRRVKLRKDETGQRWCSSFSNQDSSMLSRLAEADGLLNVAPFAPEQPINTPVQVSLFPS